MIRFAGLGHAGLALSTSAVALFGFCLLFEILRRRIGGVYGRELAGGIGKVLIASLVMAAVTALSQPRHGTLAGRFATGAPGRSGGLDPHRACSVFYGMCRALGVHEVDMAIRAFTRPVQPPLPAENRALILRAFSTDKVPMSGLLVVFLYLLAADPATGSRPLATTCSEPPSWSTSGAPNKPCRISRRPSNSVWTIPTLGWGVAGRW